MKAGQLRALTDLYDDAARGETGGREAVLRHQPLQGSAGPGKTTTIGSRRLAWLVPAERGEGRATPETSLVFTPNRVLAAYAAQVLPVSAFQINTTRVNSPRCQSM